MQWSSGLAPHGHCQPSPRPPLNTAQASPRTGMLMAPPWWAQMSLGDMMQECQAGAPSALGAFPLQLGPSPSPQSREAARLGVVTPPVCTRAADNPRGHFSAPRASERGGCELEPEGKVPVQPRAQTARESEGRLHNSSGCPFTEPPGRRGPPLPWPENIAFSGVMPAPAAASCLPYLCPS
ncbi:hypothetical protein J1605_008030 [Eschrichtius robustus]|uniref:Uncharacterized protein n=1 Tax=Eschrichtius robustus TaxID=9764 RepID=A0AB34GZ11_ESCRO|nr:hypothetical protein J1605_008030 [Eschrichtius robustus]